LVKRVLFTGAVTILLTACVGPIDYLNTTARKAQRALSEAKTANAEKMSPYEYWSALVYIRMAREKAAHADYQDAWKYGRKAEKMGKLAIKLAQEKAQEGPSASPPTPSETPVSVEPAGSGDSESPPVTVEPNEGSTP
jgi:hypothetical protein